MRILIAEDDPISRRLLEATVKKWGYEVVVCVDGRQALSQLQVPSSPPDMAILDWMMPEIDGPEVCRRFRESTSAAPVYIILLTAKGQREDLIEGLQSGADDYVTKPFHKQELYARIQAGIRITDLQRRLATKVTDLEVALMRLRRLQQAQKLEALGQLASGVAHEINTPIQYISNNMRFLQESWQEIQRSLPAGSSDPDLQFLIEEVPRAIDQSLEGVLRVSKIVRAMRDFSHPAGENKVATEINRAIETTVTIATNEWKDVADVVLQLESKLPNVLCLPGELHQVLLNIVVNAAQAISDVVSGTNDKGTIRISTSAADGFVEIRINDTGAGIREEHQQKVFDPFFTTKDVGKGTGQGLAIAHSVVVQQHNGRIWFETELGRGTTFIIQLPIDGIGATAGETHEANLVR
jgi:signal transduction histidine kinase